MSNLTKSFSHPSTDFLLSTVLVPDSGLCPKGIDFLSNIKADVTCLLVFYMHCFPTHILLPWQPRCIMHSMHNDAKYVIFSGFLPNFAQFSVSKWYLSNRNRFDNYLYSKKYIFSNKLKFL